MHRGAKIGFRTGHHPTVDHHHVQVSEIGLALLTEALLPQGTMMFGKLGGQRPAALARFRITPSMKLPEVGRMAGVAENFSEKRVGAGRGGQPASGPGETGKRQKSQLEQTATVHGHLSLR